MPPPPVREASVVATTVSYETLQAATGAFQQRIGRGAFGDVFLGRAIWRAGEAIAVKRWRQDSRQVVLLPLSCSGRCCPIVWAGGDVLPRSLRFQR
jgi:hypothetical protein